MNKIRKFMRNFKIGTRLLASFGLIIILVIILNATAIFNINKLSRNTVELYNNSYSIIDKVWESRKALSTLEKNLFRAIDYHESDIEKNFIAVSNEIKTINDCIEYLKQIKVKNQKLSDLLEQYETKMLSLENCVNKIDDLVTSGKSEPATNTFENEYMAISDSTTEIAVALYDTANKEAIDFVANSKKSRVSTIIKMDTVFAITFISALFLAFLSTTNITKPMKKMVHSINEVSKGNLNLQIDDIGNDELTTLSNATSKLVTGLKDIITDITYNLGEMASGNLNVDSTQKYEGDFIPIQESIVKIINSLNRTLIKINQASNLVSNGSDQMATSAQSLSEGAGEQSTSIESLSDIIDNVSENIKINAENATKSFTLTNQAGEKLMISNQKVQDMLFAMKEITEAAQKIRNIVETINSIASQTNILALNAAIESARAGIAGQSFAVVADKVRNLASQSSKAASETTIIVENTIKLIEKGRDLADKTARSISDVMLDAKSVTDIVQNISYSSNEQSISIEQVALGVEKIALVVQTNSEIADESAAASQELNSQAKLLKGLVEKFELKDLN